MKRNFLILTVAAQLAVGGAFAQTSTTASGMADTGTSSGTFGSDWSTTLGLAMFSDGNTTVRSESELASQWNTLSEEDKEMIRRDCAEIEQHSDAASGSTGSANSTTGATTGATGMASDTTATTTASTGSTSGATTGAASGTTGTGTTSGTTSTGAAAGTADIGSGAVMSVSMEQMEEICAVTNDL